MKLNKEEFAKMCAEVISNLVCDDVLSSSTSKMTVMLVGTVVVSELKGKLFSEDEEIDIVSNSSGCEDK